MLELSNRTRSYYCVGSRFNGKISRKFSTEKIVPSLLVVTSLPVLIQFGGKHLKDMFGMLFISISDII